jgi:hypothetical protein
VSGDVVCIQLTIQGTFLGPLQTPAGPIQPTGAKIAFTTLYAQLGVLPDYASAVAAPVPAP